MDGTLDLKRIRVVLAALPRMLADIVESMVAAQPDMMVANRLAGEATLETSLRENEPHVLIVGLAPEEDASRYDALLYDHPRLKVFAITSTGRDAYLYELQPVQHPIGNVSPEGLMAAIRGAATAVAH